MSKKNWFYVAFFVLLSGGFYFVIKDYMAPNSSKLAVIKNELPGFNFITQDSIPYNQDSVRDKVYVAEYFFTTCTGICPRMNANMRKVYDEFKTEPGFRILSHTCMPETDSIPLMKAYEQKMLRSRLSKRMDGTLKFENLSKADSSKSIDPNINWVFLTGSKDELYKLARQGYLIDNGKPDSVQLKDQFIHTQFFALVDKYGRLRGIYDGLKGKEIDMMIGDIKDLLVEKVNYVN